MHGIIDAVLAFLHLNLGGTANTDNGNTASQLGKTLLQFLTVIVRRCLLGLGADLVATCFDLGLFADTVNDGGFILGDLDALGRAQHLEGHAVERNADFLRDYCPLCQDREVFQHRLATIAKARCLHSGNLQTATQTVDDECGQCLTLDVFSNDQKRAT